MLDAVCFVPISPFAEHFLFLQDVEIMLGEAVGFVADVLEQLENR